MELKYCGYCADSVFTVLLIVLNGIEMQHAEEHRRGRLRLLIVLNGIEIIIFYGSWGMFYTFNRTKWN